LISEAPRRFYREVTVLRGDDGWQVALDGKLLRSPMKAALILPSEALAMAVRAEWDAQGERIRPASMPMMQLASTAVDRVLPNREQIVADVTAYAASDLLCYRAATPADLVRRQEEQWQSLLDWANHRFDVSLCTTTGIMAVEQSAQSLAILKRVVDQLDPWRLTALASVTATAGSLVIALALLEGRVTPEAAVAAAHLDELFQAERWGEDAEAMVRRRGQAQDIADAARFVTLLDGSAD
jgi:chaperone required for assembly of F1-ATPase